MSFWGMYFAEGHGLADVVFKGYKFETLSLISDQWDMTSRELIENRENVVVNNYAQYCSVVKTRYLLLKISFRSLILGLKEALLTLNGT